MSAERRGLILRRLLLLGIGGTAVALRFVGLSWGLPYELHPDEPLILAIAERMEWGNLNPGFFHYPGFFIYQVFLLGRAVFALGGEHADLLYAARFLSAAYSLATVWLVYVLGARLGDRRLGTIAAALVAWMGALTLQAHYAVTDTAVTALATAVVSLSVRGWQRRSYAELSAATAVAGLAVSTKYSVAPICFVPWLGFMALAARRGMPLARRAGATLALAGVAVAAFLAASPYTLLDHRAFARDLREEVALQAEARSGEHSEALEDPEIGDRGVVGNFVEMYDDMGPAAFVLALGTLGLLLVHAFEALPTFRRDDGAASGAPDPATRATPAVEASAFERLSADPIAPLMVVVWVLVYFAMMAPAARYGERYVLPLYPAMMLLAAVPLWGATVAASRSGRRRAVALAGVALLAAIGPPAVDAFGSTRLLARRDTRLVARDWIIDNVPTGSRLAREFYAPPFHESDGFRLLQPFALTDLSLEAYCRDDVDYLVLSSANADRYRSDPERYADQLAWYDRLDANTRLVHRVEGVGNVPRHQPAIEVRLLRCRPDAGGHGSDRGPGAGSAPTGTP